MIKKAIGYLTGGVGSIFGWVADSISAILQALAVWFAFRLGTEKAQAKEVKKDAEIKDKQLRIAARPNRSRAEHLERMRRRLRGE